MIVLYLKDDRRINLLQYYALQSSYLTHFNISRVLFFSIVVNNMLS